MTSVLGPVVGVALVAVALVVVILMTWITADTSATARSLVNLALVVEALSHGVTADARPDAAAVGPVGRAIDSFLDTLAAAYISAADEAFAPLDLDRLRRAGIPTVLDEEYASATATTGDRRRLLTGLLLDDGWALPSTG